MRVGLPKYVHVNLSDIEDARFQEGEEVSLETLKEKGVINPSGRERKLPLKVPISCWFNDTQILSLVLSYSCFSKIVFMMCIAIIMFDL